MFRSFFSFLKRQRDPICHLIGYERVERFVIRHYAQELRSNASVIRGDTQTSQSQCLSEPEAKRVETLVQLVDSL